MQQAEKVHASAESPADRLDRAFRTALTIPKEALLKEEAKEKRAKDRKKRKKS